MSEYISRESVHDALAEYVSSGFAESASDLQGYTDKINAIPSADVRENIHARWEYGFTFPDGNYCRCTACKEIIKCIYPMRFCPNCGAIMDGKEGKA